MRKCGKKKPRRKKIRSYELTLLTPRVWRHLAWHSLVLADNVYGRKKGKRDFHVNPSPGPRISKSFQMKRNRCRVIFSESGENEASRDKFRGEKLFLHKIFKRFFHSTFCIHMWGLRGGGVCKKLRVLEREEADGEKERIFFRNCTTLPTTYRIHLIGKLGEKRL